VTLSQRSRQLYSFRTWRCQALRAGSERDEADPGASIANAPAVFGQRADEKTEISGRCWIELSVMLAASLSLHA